MYNTFNLQLIEAQCPNDKNRKNCPVQQYLDNQEFFHQTINETLLKPSKSYLAAREEFIAALDAIHSLCAKCKQGKSK